eukprot:1763500-Prymnesium_polylepis.1
MRLPVSSERLTQMTPEALVLRPGLLVDTEGDGIANAVLADTVGDGRADAILPIPPTAALPAMNPAPLLAPGALVDTVGDGEADAILADTVGDGRVDLIMPIVNPPAASALNPSDTTAPISPLPGAPKAGLNTHPHAARQGFLIKEPRQGNAFSRSRRRFFVLSGSTLEWFEDDRAGSTSKGELSLQGAELALDKGSLTVLSGHERLELHGESIDEWEAALRQATAVEPSTVQDGILRMPPPDTPSEAM